MPFGPAAAIFIINGGDRPHECDALGWAVTDHFAPPTVRREAGANFRGNFP